MTDITYGLKYKSKCITPQQGYSGGIRFLIGTSSVSEENQIHLVEFNDDDEDVVCVNVYPHTNEVIALCSSPNEAKTLATSSTEIKGANVGNKVCVWNIVEDEVNASIEMVFDVPLGKNENAVVSSLLWGEANEDILFTVESGRMRGWNVDMETCSVDIPLADRLLPVGGASINPHFSNVVALCVGDDILGFDTRDSNSKEGKPIWKLQSEGVRVRDCDFNPNKPYFMCAGGDDGHVRFWDYRKTEILEHSFQNNGASFRHSHWVTCVQYNPHHDSLVLSSGTDGSVNLYNASSVSSAPLTNKNSSDYVISSYERFSQSVYQACWSSSDAWVYASVCYSGKAVFRTVPDKEKMMILIPP